MIAADEGAIPAARPLAQAIYRDAELRPGIDDATARVLAGEAPAPDAPAKLKEMSEVRASLGRSGSDAAARRLLASIGADLSARLVVTVNLEQGRPVARVLRVETGAFEGLELGATIETTAAGEKVYQWPGAVAALHGLATGAMAAPGAGTTAPADGRAAAKGAGPIRPEATPKDGSTAPSRKDKALEESRREGSSSPWLWVALGALVAGGITAIVVANTSGDPGTIETVHLKGRVPR